MRIFSQKYSLMKLALMITCILIIWRAYFTSNYRVYRFPEEININRKKINDYLEKKQSEYIGLNYLVLNKHANEKNPYVIVYVYTKVKNECETISNELKTISETDHKLKCTQSIAEFKKLTGDNN